MFLGFPFRGEGSDKVSQRFPSFFEIELCPRSLSQAGLHSIA